MKLKLGNLKKDEEVTITLKYLENLTVAMNKFWRLIIPSTVTPRY